MTRLQRLQSSRSFENQVIKFQLHEKAKIRMSKLQPAHRSFFDGLNEVQWALDFRKKNHQHLGRYCYTIRFEICKFGNLVIARKAFWHP